MRPRGTRRTPSLIGAARFGLGTSSPPGYSEGWREVSGSGAKWLGYAVPGAAPNGYQRADPIVWALIPTARMAGSTGHTLNTSR